MKRTVPVESASAFIDAKINELGDWRGKTLAKVRLNAVVVEEGVVDVEQEDGAGRGAHGRCPLLAIARRRHRR